MLKVKQMYVNSDNQWITNTNGYKLRITPNFFVKENILMRWEIIDQNNNPVDLTGYTFKFGFDNVFTTGHTDLVLSDNSKFNISGDWSEMDVSQGKICCRVDCTSATYATFMDDDVKKTAYADLWAIPVSGAPTLLTQFTIECRNPISNPLNYDVGGIGYMTIGSTFVVV
jgi:hypothetical protein